MLDLLKYISPDICHKVANGKNNGHFDHLVKKYEQ
jgi:hypothetical protein